MDKALRVWNFQDKSSELISFFDDAPLAVSLHPSGLYLLVSFGEKVKTICIRLPTSTSFMLRDVFQATLRILSPWQHLNTISTILLEPFYSRAGLENQE